MTRTLLIVDDIKINREILKNMLGREYAILEASNGREAIEVMTRDFKDISAVLLDLSMPVMDGFETLAEMQKSELLTQLPVIVTTGQTDSGSEENALKLGAKDYISKPYNTAIIRQRIRNTINLRETAATINALQRDRLTGLYTREAFFDKTVDMINAHEAGYYAFSSINIDNFKVINDQYGTSAGDDALKHIAQSLDRLTQEIEGICCRMMADKFAMLCPVSFVDSKVMQKFRDIAVSPPMLKSQIGIRVGRYIVNDLSLTPSGMYDRATLAQDSIKGQYGRQTAVYDEAMRKRLLDEQRIVNEMDLALSSNQFEVWYQPQYNHSTKALIGAEALVRWRHPERGLVSPGIFVPIFEKNGFIYNLDKFVWEEVCKNLRSWIDVGRNPLPISVNISRYDVHCPDLIDVLAGLIAKYSIPVELLRVEITESAFMESAHEIVGLVKTLIDKGFTVEIDDFGSGYSSLNTLKDVPAQIVKLDMKFLDSSTDSQRGGNIVESVVRMTKWLGMSIIAEGVETIEQANYLSSIGCSYVQGYLYARPMPKSDYEALCKGITKEERLITMETAPNLDNNKFWDPDSMDTLIFNSYVGAACIFEYNNGAIELLRASEKYAHVFGADGITVDEALRLNWDKHLTDESRAALKIDIEKSVETKSEVVSEYVFIDLPKCPHETYLRSTIRVIASVGARKLIYCRSENMTAQRAAERETRDMTEQINLIMANVNSGIAAASFDEAGKVNIIFANDMFYGIYGYTKEQFEKELGGAMNAIIPEDRKRVDSTISNLIRERGSVTMEYRCKKRDGSIIHINCVSSVTSFAGVSDDVLLSVTTDVTESQKAMENLRMSEESNRLAITLSETVVCRYYVEDKRLEVSPITNRIFDVPDTLYDVPESQIREGRISNDTAKAYRELHEKITLGIPNGSALYQRISSNGWRWIEAKFATIFSSDGKPVSAVIAYVDVTDKLEKEAVYKKWQQSIEDKELSSYSLFRCAVSSETKFETIEGSLIRQQMPKEPFNFDENTERYSNEFVYIDDVNRFRDFLNVGSLTSAFFSGNRIMILEYREKTENNGYKWLKLTVDLVDSARHNNIEAYLLFENIDKEKRQELITLEQAETDAMTGVLNRSAFAAQVNDIVQTKMPEAIHALLMLDMDGFKRVNDVFGHASGDQALIDIAKTLKNALSEKDLAGRLGGDEFVIFLTDIPNEAYAANKARQICALMRKSFSPEVEVSGSIGITLIPRDGTDFDSLYNKVDAALYHVKDSGKDNYAIYQDDMLGEHLDSAYSEERSPKVESYKRRRMLIVDDSVIDHALLSKIFSGSFIIEKAKDGETALIRLRHFGSAISVVLLDLMMPGISGFTVLKRMRESSELRNIPVIVVSGDESREAGLNAIREGAVDFVNKPVDPEILRIRVMSAISKAENEKLRAKNSFLEYQNNEINLYKVALEKSGMFVIENDWITGAFKYDSSISQHITGVYNDRKFWQILLSDFVADTVTVQRMQEMTHSLAIDRERAEAKMVVVLRAPNNERRRFSVNAYKAVNEFGLTSKIYTTFMDLGAE